MSDGNQVKAENQGQVPERLETEGQNISELEDSITELEQRFAPVLAPSDEAHNEGEAPQQYVPVAEKINEHNSAIVKCKRRIEDLIQRAEL